MKQEHRDTIIFYILLAMKVLTTVRTGWDTFIVSRDVLNVVLLDGAFFGLWLMLAYGGKGQLALRIRPFAAGGAYLMYALMLVIGWEAHADTPLVALAVRIAGGLLLAYDSWDYLVTLNHVRREAMGKTLAERQRNLREKLWDRAYREVSNKEYKQFVKQSLLHMQSDIEGDTDYREALPIMPPVRKALPSGDRSENVPRTFQERDVDTTRQSVIRRWAGVSPQLPDEFTRQDFQDICGCAKTQAFEAITYGKSVGEIVEVERGLYKKQIVIDGQAKELPSEGF